MQIRPPWCVQKSCISWQNLRYGRRCVASFFFSWTSLCVLCDNTYIRIDVYESAMHTGWAVDVCVSPGLFIYSHMFMSHLCTDHELINKTISSCHAIIASVWACVLLCADTCPSIGMPLTDAQACVLHFSTGYFIYDVLYSAWTSAWDTVFHHVATLSGMLYGLMLNVSGTELCWGLVMTEMGTPILHFRYFLILVYKNYEKMLADHIQLDTQLSNESAHTHTLTEAPKDLMSQTHTHTQSPHSDTHTHRHTRTHVSKAKTHLETTLDKVSMIFAIQFIAMRCLAGPFLTCYTITSPTTPLFVKVCHI